jgi:hypothetical protein
MPVLLRRLALLFGACSWLYADRLSCDMSAYLPQAGLTASLDQGGVSVAWDGERGQHGRARFDIADHRPVLAELAVRGGSGDWSVLGRNLVPEFSTVSGVRRTGHGLPEELRWYVFWDAPLSVPGAGDQPGLPRRPEEIRRASATFDTRSCAVKSDGARLEVSFPGLSMGIFTGGLQFTVYRGSNLLRMEAIAKTGEPSAAYIYTAGLRGFDRAGLSAVEWRDPGGNDQRFELGGSVNESPVALRARNRVAIATGTGGALAVFPPPHQFFFAREIEVNLGYVWYRKDAADSFSFGVRQGENEEGYEPVWAERVWSLYNAPAGTWQRMPAYFYVSTAGPGETRNAALAYTHGDRYKPMPGFQAMATHFHTAFTQELTKSGSLDTLAPWIPAMRALGINIAHIFDFHGDGHPDDTGDVRLSELANYFEACRRHSDKSFLIVPGEEANVYFGGHYNVLFPRPVFWTHRRAQGQEPVETDPRRGKVYHVANARELYDVVKAENALVWQTHPRTKGSTGYPDRIREADYFRDPHWLGSAFKAMPVDLSERRLCDARCFGTLDDMNNWAGPKYMLGEVDTYKKFPDYDLYGDFNVNYVRLANLPPANDWSPILEALRSGDFFVTTGEILIHDFRRTGTGVSADVEWTFPLEFVEVVWSDGETVQRKEVHATERAPFGRARFDIPVALGGQKWVRLAVWDSAVNGAFTQPLWLNPGQK